MQFLHQREYLHQGDVAVVNCSHRCNIRLMSDSDFSSYRRCGSHHYFGGHYDRLPARIEVPEDGYWNITLDLGATGVAHLRNE